LSYAGNQASYCFNVISSSNIGAIPTNPGCLNVVCLTKITSSACIADRSFLTLLTDVFEIFLASEDKLDNYFIILPDNGTILSHNSLTAYLNYANIGVCVGTTSTDLRNCIIDPNNCDSTVKQCLSYINCKGRYVLSIIKSILSMS